MAARQPARHPQVQRHTGADYEAGRVHRRNEAQPLLGHKGVLQPPQGAALGPGKGPTEVIRMGRGGSQWKTIKQFPSWKEAKAAMRKGTLEGKWEWASNSSSPITGRRAYYKCAAHVACEVRLCLQEQEADDQVVVAIDLSKEHGEEARTKKRKNSALTYEQEEKVKRQPSRTPRLCDTDMIY
jgi:hypothetical protein